MTPTPGGLAEHAVRDAGYSSILADDGRAWRQIVRGFEMSATRVGEPAFLATSDVSATQSVRGVVQIFRCDRSRTRKRDAQGSFLGFLRLTVVPLKVV